MFVRMIYAATLMGAVLVGLTACDRPKSTTPASQSSTPHTFASSATSVTASGVGDVSTIHWLGKKRIAADTNAAAIMTLWKLPESVKLGDQTLDKLALAPWRLLQGDAATNGAPSALLRALLDDLVAEESHLTIQHSTNQPAAWALAVRLPSDRHQVWKTNLATVLESLTKGRAEPTADGFVCPSAGLQPPLANSVFRLARTSDWTVLTLAAKNLEFGIGSPQLSTNWLALSLDLAAINQAFKFGWTLPVNCPRVELRTSGDGQSVQTRGLLSFAVPPAIQIQPWNMPTNLVHDPLASFTACRVAMPLLESLPQWSGLNLGRAPDQFYVWSQAGMPFQTYYAAPLPNVSNRVHLLKERLFAQANPWLATNGIGKFESLTNDHGVHWSVPPMMDAFVCSTVDPGGTPWFFAGHVGQLATNRPMPPELMAMISGDSKLIWYDWEITEQRIEDWFYIGQLLRIALNQAQVPQPSQASLWLNAIKSRLGNCGSSVQVQNSSRLVFNRRSGFPLSAAELHLLIDWLESPKFPRGLYSELAAPDTFVRQSLIKLGAAVWVGPDDKPLVLTNTPTISPR